MGALTNHFLSITDQCGENERGKVIYLQPKSERWREDHAVVHIVTSGWLDPYRHKAVYNTPKQSVSGFFMPHRLG
jgi:hypothetical protein